MVKFGVVIIIVVGLAIVWKNELLLWMKKVFAKGRSRYSAAREKEVLKKSDSYNLNRVVIDYTSQLNSVEQGDVNKIEKQEPKPESPKGLDFLKQFEEITNKNK